MTSPKGSNIQVFVIKLLIVVALLRNLFVEWCRLEHSLSVQADVTLDRSPTNDGKGGYPLASPKGSNMQVFVIKLLKVLAHLRNLFMELCRPEHSLSVRPHISSSSSSLFSSPFPLPSLPSFSLSFSLFLPLSFLPLFPPTPSTLLPVRVL